MDEEEPEDFRGSNDTLATAQRIPAFGSASNRRPAARILGTLAPPADAEPFDAKAEDNGSIPLTDETGLSGSGSSTTTDATIGDGPHGSDGDESGDFDFYAVREAAAGQRLVVDIDTPADSKLDSLVFLYDAEGNAIAVNDDGETLDSLLNFVLPAAGDYYVSVAGFPNVQDDPQDSGSGDGADSEGDYTVTFGLDSIDVDTYAVNLRAGDVLGGSVAGSGNVLERARHRRARGPRLRAGCLLHLPGQLAAAGRRQRGGRPRRRAQRAPLRHRDRQRGALRRHARGLPAGAAAGGRRPDAVPRLRRPAREHGPRSAGRACGRSPRCRPSSVAGAFPRRSTTRCRTASSTRSRRT